MQSPNFECGANVTDCCHMQSKPCLQGAVPEYAIVAGEAFHVQEAIRFAARHHVRVVVKATGHDWQGRSTAAGSLLIWVRELNTIQFHAVQQEPCEHPKPPEPYTDPSSPVGAVTVGGGAQWGSVYEEADRRGVAIVGGHYFTVGAAGGYLQGGGHSPLSPMYGLAVDNLLRVKIVTPDGVLRNATPCENADLFWALRGGGGGTWGVIISATYATHPVPSNMVDFKLNIITTHEPMLDLTGAVLDWIAHLDANWPGRWSGYLSYNTWLPGGVRRLRFIMLFVGAFDEFERGADFIRQFLRRRRADYNVTDQAGNASTFMGWKGPDLDRTGVSSSLSSRLIPGEDLNSTAKREEIKAAWRETVARSPVSSVLLIAGGAVNRYDPQSLSTSVTPAWRRALLMLVALSFWPVQAPDVYVRAQYQLLSDVMQDLRRLTPNSGTYWNEADYFEDMWPQSFWGLENYARLKRVKEMVDPGRVFQCWQCVHGTQPEPDMVARPSTTKLRNATTKMPQNTTTLQYVSISPQQSTTTSQYTTTKLEQITATSTSSSLFPGQHLMVLSFASLFSIYSLLLNLLQIIHSIHRTKNCFRSPIPFTGLRTALDHRFHTRDYEQQEG